MSNDLHLLTLEQNAQALAPLRSNPPLHAALATWEDVGADPLDALEIGLADYIRGSTGPVEPVHALPFCTGHGYTYALTDFANRAVTEAQRTAAFQAFLPLAQRLSGLVRDLPDRTLERVGVGPAFSSPLHDWIWVLFRLAWHYPDHFARGVVHRDRLLRDGDRVLVAPEDWLQLGGASGTPRDYHPGLIFSRFPRELDLVTATGYAIDLLRHAVRGGDTFEMTEALRDQLLHLHREFAAAGTLFAERHPGTPGADLDVRVLRLDSSFRTPPASQWSGYRAGGAIQEDLFLARSGPVKEVCVLRGPAVGDFTRRANQAGALLPAWPEHPAAALLQDASGWLGRVARRRELRSEQYYFATEDGSPPQGTPIPPSQVVEQYWASTRPFPGWGGLVTDHRGNVERWVGFVLYMLKEYQPDAVEIRTLPEEAAASVHGWNAMLTLRGMNLYQASARAMELAGWVYVPTRAGSQQRPAEAHVGESERSAVCFEEPWEEAPYPPPEAGRYIRFHRGDLSSSGEPEWRPGWAWAERPEDGWVECGECGSGSNRVLIALGRPPAACTWLPPDWPADFYPLGEAAAHCAGWRELVRSVFGHGHDTIPPDDPRYGWRTLTRATRHLAHHLGVVPLDRVLAPLPATRAEAQREVEPLLDGLVFARTGSGATPVAQTPPDPHRVLMPIIRRLLSHLTDAEVNLSGFRGPDEPFDKAAADWNLWRGSVAGVTLRETAAALRGVIDRNPLAPHRTLPEDLVDLWLRVRCWGPGRATTREEFEGSAHQTEWSAVTNGLASFRARFRRLLLYLGSDLPDENGSGVEATVTRREEAETGEGARPVIAPLIDQTELTILTELRNKHPVLLKNVDIEVATNLSKQTVSRVITELVAKKFAARPKGKRRGATVTPEGTALVDRARKSSPDHP